MTVISTAFQKGKKLVTTAGVGATMLATAACTTTGGNGPQGYTDVQPATSARAIEGQVNPLGDRGYVTAERLPDQNGKPIWRINQGAEDSSPRKGFEIATGKEVGLVFSRFVVRGDPSGTEFPRLSREIRGPMAQACGFELVDHTIYAAKHATGTEVDLSRPNQVSDFGETRVRVEGDMYGTPSANKLFICGTQTQPTGKVVNFVVNFDFDKSVLAESEKLKIRNAIREANATGVIVAIDMGGHTDTMGKDSYNMGLSHRRNRAVHDYLRSQDIVRDLSSDKITAVGYGERLPAVNTGDQVPLRANRRVEGQITTLTR